MEGDSCQISTWITERLTFGCVPDSEFRNVSPFRMTLLVAFRAARSRFMAEVTITLCEKKRGSCALKNNKDFLCCLRLKFCFFQGNVGQ